MSDQTFGSVTSPDASRGLNLIYAFIATAIVYALSLSAQAAGAGIPNSDDVMRLITLRDLVGGQGWFDPMQYRLGLDGGTFMHWSRLVDAPLAAMYFLAFFITANQSVAEQTVLIIWPAVSLFIAILGLNVACVRISAPRMRMPVTIIGAVAFMTSGIFSVGALDHHNIQVALSIWLIALLIPGSGQNSAHAGAGVIAVLMLAIGMETLPYVTVAGVWVALRFLFGKSPSQHAASFGVSLGLSSVLIFVMTVAPASYCKPYCDSYSIFHIAMCGVGGFGLAITAGFSQSFKGRFVGLAIAGVTAALLLAFVFPECLSNPLSALDPKLRTFWLEGVVETRSAMDLWTTDPFQLFGMFGMAITALLATVFMFAKGDAARREFAIFCGVMLLMAIGVTAWQQRGMMFASAFAVLPLGLVVSKLREDYLESRSIGSLLRMTGMGVLSLNMFWWIAGANAAALFAAGPTLQQQAATVSARDYCYTEEVYEMLKNEPMGVVLGATDIGAMVLKWTSHRALAGPYHRNTDGNLAMIEAMLATPDMARPILEKSDVTIIADCLNSADAHDFKKAAPNGLQAELHSGNVPQWLEMVPETIGSPLVLYRFRP